MGRSEFEDPKLTEVKAILARLQRIDPDDEPMPRPARGSPARATGQGTIVEQSGPPPARAPLAETLPPPMAAPMQPTIPARSASGPLGLALICGSAAVAIGLFVTRAHWLPKPAPAPVPSVVTATAAPMAAPVETSRAVPPTAAVPATPIEPAKPIEQSKPAEAAAPLAGKAALQNADRLIRSGRLVAGRAELLRIAPENKAEIAWALARAFDPNVVGGIAGADAAADVEQAITWYRQWHALAIQEGLVADSVSVDRIIRTMRQ